MSDTHLSVLWAHGARKNQNNGVSTVAFCFSVPLLMCLLLHAHCSHLVTPGPPSTKYEKSVPY